jgi:raffinose/stachyose/melibiose transport system substrate-binding protein
MKRRRLGALFAAAVLLALGGCGGTPGQEKPTPQPGEADREVRTGGFERLGEVRLRVVSSETSGGPRAAMRELSRQFEAKYPNVNVDVSFRDFNSWVKQVKLSLAGDSPPDVVAGNQGYQVDGELVKAGLIRNLDPYAKAYGWSRSFSPDALQQFKWSPDGRRFGEGPIWGIAQNGQSTGVFANLAKLRAAGVDPAALKSFADFEAALRKVKASVGAREAPIMLGNKEQYPAIHVWGTIQGAYEPAQKARDWVFHRPGATFDTPGNRESLEKLKAWDDAGYLGAGDDYNGRGEQDAATLFARGEGAFFLGGNWNAQTILDGLGRDAMFFTMPPGASGKVAAIGAASTPFHVASKSKQPDLAAAYIDFVAGRPAGRVLVDNSIVPAVVDPTAEPTRPLSRQLTRGWQQLLDAGGLTLFPDWSSPTMLDTMGRSFQELLAGRASVTDITSRIQEDWKAYDAELRGR